MLQPEIRKNVRHNFAVNVIDGAFFGLALGFASNVAIVPLFVAELTDSTTLIGLIATILMLGWQLPQLFTAGYVARLRRYKRMTVFMSFQERWPFFGLALVAALSGTLGSEVTLVLAYLLLIWQALGGGFTATAWQSMIGKIIPAGRLGTFYGVQSAAANLLMSGGVVAAGVLVERVAFPRNFALAFLISGVFIMISLAFLAATREPEGPPADETRQNIALVRRNIAQILRSDGNFRLFLGARMLSQFSTMAIAFYTIYAVREFGMSAATAGLMGGILTLTQTVSSPLLGWLGDRCGHRRMFAFGNGMMALSAFLALSAASLNWFYAVFALAGVVNTVQWTTIIAITTQFGTPARRPFYIGLTNTLIAPATLTAPLIGGWLADSLGFGATFTLSIASGLLTALVLQFLMVDPRRVGQAASMSPAVAGQHGD